MKKMKKDLINDTDAFAGQTRRNISFTMYVKCGFWIERIINQ